MNKITALFTLLLKATKSLNLTQKAFKSNNNKIVRIDNKANKINVDSFRNSMRIPNIGAIREPTFLTLDAKKNFNHLKLEFIKTPIFRYFDLKNHIQIEIDVSNYAIDRVLS